MAHVAKLTRLDKAAIRNGARTLRKERMFLDVLCCGYTSVYYYDVDSNEMEALKMVNTATVACKPKVCPPIGAESSCFIPFVEIRARFGR